MMETEIKMKRAVVITPILCTDMENLKIGSFDSQV